MDSDDALSSQLDALLKSGVLTKDVAAILELAAFMARERPDLQDPLPFRDSVRKVSLIFRELYGDEATSRARRVAAKTGNSALARIIVNDLQWLRRDEVRQAALADYDILDTPSESGFDDIALIASHVCETPIALVSLVETHRQWFKAAVGTEIRETTLDNALCIHTINHSGLLIIPDLTQDSRTRTNPFVQGPSKIRFYAAVPLVTPAGIIVGVLCVIDREPRPQGLTPIQARVLEALARQTVAQLELRRLTAGAAVGPRTASTGDC